MTAYTRKKLKITVTGETFDDLQYALHDIITKLEDEYLSGFAGNETGDYEFEITTEVY